MKTFFAAIATTGFIGATGLGLAAVASAAPLAGASAADAVSSLQARGYDVQINGDQSADLAQCTVTDINGLRGSLANGMAGVATGSTVYVGVSCDDDHDE